MQMPMGRTPPPDRLNVKTLIQIVPVILVMGTIFFLSHQSGDSLHLPAIPGVDKIAHMTAYAGLALSFLWLFHKRAVKDHRRTAILTVLFCVLYGISDEFHQSFIPLRSVSVLDLLADGLGAALVTAVWLRFPALQQRLIRCQDELAAFSKNRREGSGRE